MPVDMLMPLLLMLLGFTLYFAAVLTIRLRAEVLRRERQASWLREVLDDGRLLRHGWLCAISLAIVRARFTRAARERDHRPA
jgi:hypothetical protein